MKRLLLAAILLAGCKHAAGPALKDAPPPALVAGWTPVSDPESGVSLSLPPGWRVGVPRAFDPNSLLNSGADATQPNPVDPAVMDMARGMQREDEAAERETLAKLREKEGIVLHCVDGSKPTIAEEPTRIYVKRLPDAGFSSLAEGGVAEKRDGHREAKTEEVSLPVGKALRLLAKGRNRIGDEECHVSYVFLDGADAYVLRFASTNAPDVILGVERQVAETFRVKKKKA